MTRPRNYQTEAIIIRKVKLGEADRILTLYTPKLGKIRAVAKGVRRPRSKLSGHLELLTHSMVSLARGRNLDTITGSQTIDSFLPLKSDLQLTACGLYISELIDQFTADNVEDDRLFRLLLDIMHILCHDVNRDLVLRYFELHLLDGAGYRPQLRQCVSCRAELQPVTNAFCPGAGGVICPDCRQQQPLHYPVVVNTLKVMRFLQENNLNNVIRLKVDSRLSRQLAEVMRHYIKYLLEREVRSAAWLDSLRQQMEEVTLGIKQA